MITTVSLSVLSLIINRSRRLRWARIRCYFRLDVHAQAFPTGTPFVCNHVIIARSREGAITGAEKIPFEHKHSKYSRPMNIGDIYSAQFDRDWYDTLLRDA